jgi:hypothetical protein
VLNEKKPVLLIDGGGLFGQRSRTDREQTRFLCQVTGEFGYDAIGLGTEDLNYGLAFLREMIDTHRLPFLSANVRELESGALLLPPYKLVERGGMRFGICAVTDPNEKIVTMGAGKSEEYRVDDPVATLNELVPRLRREADTVILLSHLNDLKTEDLLREVSGIDIALVGHTHRSEAGQRVVGKTVVLAAGFEGRVVGRADALIDRQGVVQAFSLAMTPMDAKVADDQVMLERIAKFKEEQEQRRMALRGAHQPTKGSADEQFLTQYECRKCHLETYQKLETSSHNRAMASLTRQGMTEEPECLVCHTTGYLFINGYDTQAPRNRLTNVQCEACHGYGTEHRRDGRWAAEARSTCVVCHDQKNSPKFDFATYWEKIRH